MQSKSNSAVVNSEDEMLQAANDDEPEDPEMLLTPSLISQSSTVSNASLALSIFNSPKRSPPSNVLADCSADSSLVKDLIVASAMGEAALNMIAGGYIGQGGKILDTLEVRSALESPLSSLVPTMFNPGFQKVGHQSHNISSFNHSSSSWPLIPYISQPSPMRYPSAGHAVLSRRVCDKNWYNWQMKELLLSYIEG